jgi:hypothetical protein
MEKFVKSNLFARSQLFSRTIAARHAGFMSDHDIYTDEEMATDPGDVPVIVEIGGAALLTLSL